VECSAKAAPAVDKIEDDDHRAPPEAINAGTTKLKKAQ
jgi:hypothetical protein